LTLLAHVRLLGALGRVAYATRSQEEVHVVIEQARENGALGDDGNIVLPRA